MLGNSARLRRGIRLLATALAALATAGCGGGGGAETTEEPGEVSFDLAAVGDSNVAGARAVLSYLNADRSRILVDGIGEQSGGGQTLSSCVGARVTNPVRSCSRFQTNGSASRAPTTPRSSPHLTSNAGDPSRSPRLRIAPDVR